MDENIATSERWLPVVDWEGFYEVSDLGNVRSVDRTVVDRSGVVLHIKGKLKDLKPGYGGYIMTSLYKGNVKKQVRVHTLVLEAFVGPRPADKECCHRESGPSDNRLSNIYWGTSSENKWDMVHQGRHWARKKTHCIRGHPLEMPNLVKQTFAKGYRNCLACKLTQSKQRYEHGQGRQFDFDKALTQNFEFVMSGKRPAPEDGHKRRRHSKSPRTCHFCGKDVPVDRHASAKYCDERCRRQAWQQKQPKAVRAERTHCPRGHPLAAPNCKTSKNGRRSCLACVRADANWAYAKRKGLPFDRQAASDSHYQLIAFPPPPAPRVEKVRITRDETRCVRGHLRTPENTYQYGSRRHCRQCCIERARERTRRQAALRPERDPSRCRHGHPWAETAMINGQGYRVCRECVRASGRKKPSRHRGATKLIGAA